MSKVFTFLRGLFRTVRLAIPKIGVGWMFTLLVVDFNRIAIVELDITAIVITSMLAIHYFLSPFQVISGRIADRNPIFGLRRTPYLWLSAVVSSLMFLLIPPVAHSMGDGNPMAFVGGFAIFIVFGVSIAVNGDSHHSLIAEATKPSERGGVMAFVHTVTILSTIMSAVVMNIVRPEYTPEAMQSLYNLTPFIVIISSFIGVVGMEKRLVGEALEKAVALSKKIAPDANPLKSAYGVLKSNPQARGFFAFVFVSIFAIFLQDNILEVFGAEVFNMDVTETTSFQPMWGGGVLIGMILMGIISTAFTIKKRTITLIGSVGTALGMLVVAFAALTQQQALVVPGLVGMGFFTGFFNVGAMSMMMDMTVEGATGLYMGMWGMAQAFGNATASLGSGALHTGLIETGLLAPNVAYFGIFAVEAAAMIGAIAIMWRLSVTRFHAVHESRFTPADLAHGLEAGATT